jgi:CII-binding regulator of phage lambda lysogenization HflD
MSTKEQQLKELLFPKKPLSSEVLEQDILVPLNELGSAVNEIREKIALTLVREAVEIASEVEAERSSDLQRYLTELLRLQEEYVGFADAVNVLNGRVEGLTQSVKQYLDKANDLVDQEQLTLAKLNAWLAKFNV